MMRSLSRCRRGAAALEFAMVAPLFLAIIGGTVEVARWGWGAAALRAAAADGARCVRVSPRRCGSLEALRAEFGGAAPVTRLDVEKSACGLRLTATGGFPAALTPGLAATSARACAH
jgi:Flp pilus assembly protein TadG